MFFKRVPSASRVPGRWLPGELTLALRAHPLCRSTCVRVCRPQPRRSSAAAPVQAHLPQRPVSRPAEIQELSSPPCRYWALCTCGWAATAPSAGASPRLGVTGTDPGAEDKVPGVCTRPGCFSSWFPTDRLGDVGPGQPH